MSKKLTRDAGTTIHYGDLNKPLDKAVKAWARKNHAATVDLYKDIHSHPELSYHEERTAAVIAARLREAGVEVTERVGGHGVVGVLSNGRGPTILVRADMDALPVEEDTGLPYASREKGVMHACGHDIHSANLTAVAGAMSAARDSWRGSIVFVAQPAEEHGAGAMEMVHDGLFERFVKPEVALGLHVEAFEPVGRIAYTPGWLSANTDSVDVTIYGRGGHGANPHDAADPIVAAAYFITALQTIVTRRIDPLEPSVITVGAIHAGRKHNIIPDKADLMLTVRTYSDDTRAKALAAIKSVAADAARATGCPKRPRVRVYEGYAPALYNDPALCAHAVEVFGGVFGAHNVVERPRTMGGEDFSVYIREAGIPGLMYEIGAASQKAVDEAAKARTKPTPLHNSRFAPEADATLKVALRSMCALAGSVLGKA